MGHLTVAEDFSFPTSYTNRSTDYKNQSDTVKIFINVINFTTVREETVFYGKTDFADQVKR
jgi:hypothetical protein